MRYIEFNPCREVKKPKKVPTLNEVWERYLPRAKGHKKTWNDDDFYYRKHLEPRFGNRRVDAIAPFDIEKMKIEPNKGTNRNRKPFAKATIKHQLVLLRRLYNIARKWNLYNGPSPIDQVEIPKLDNRKTEYMTDEESGRLLRVLETWPCKDSVAFIKFAMFTGFRRGELFKLQWNDVDFEKGLVTLRDPKGGSTSTIPVSNEALEVIKALPVTSLYVFPGKNGKQRTDFKGPWKCIRKAAGLPEDFRFHGLRHHFASTLVSNGVDLAVVKELLTHKDISTTQRYAHLSPGALKEAAVKSGKLLQPEKKVENVVDMFKE